MQQEQSVANNQMITRRWIFSVATPAIALICVLTGLQLPDGLANKFLITVGAAVTAAWVVILLQRALLGDPYTEFLRRMTILADAHNAGLERVLLDRNAYFAGPDIAALITGSRSVYIQGIALGFFTRNSHLLQALGRVASSNGAIEIVMAHPGSDIVRYRDKEERWADQLPSEVTNKMKDIVDWREAHPERIKLFAFRGEIHNTLIATDTWIVVSPYVFGKRGWQCPVLVFRKTNAAVVSAFADQSREIFKYAKEIDTNALQEIRTKADVEALAKN